MTDRNTRRTAQLYEALEELTALTILDEGSPQSFRARAYENAILELRAAPGDISQLTEAQLVKLSGIGRSTANKIREFFESGTITKLQELRTKYPPEFVQLSKIPGLGPKTLARLRAELGIQNVADLRQAIERQALRDLKGLGAKLEQKLAKAIDRLGLTGKDQRTPIGAAMKVARALVAELDELPQVHKVQYCGSLRRFRETIGDIDILVASEQPEPVMAHFVGLPTVREVIVQGDTKTSILTDQGLQVDLRVVKPAQFGAAIQYFTGSKAHNVKLRKLAQDRGWTLNEYGLTEVAGGAVIAADKEESVYEALDLQWVPPPMREDTGEVEQATARKLPVFAEVTDLLGDLHLHTELSGDAHSSLEQVLAAATARGYRYLAVTDHAENLGMNGVSRAQLSEQRAQLCAAQERYPQLQLLAGCELNIGADGSLDYDLEFRMQLDWCVASVHSHFDLDQAAQTRRIIAAMEDPSVHMIGHLSARSIGRRPPIELDIPAILQAAADTGTVLEINSALGRLDASAEVIRKSAGTDVLFAIDSDAHHIDNLDMVKWGILQAQRGWLERDRIINTWAPERFARWREQHRDTRP